MPADYGIDASDLIVACFSCGEEAPRGDCPKSLRPCGHHCNHTWSHDACCWCSAEFGEEPAVPGTAQQKVEIWTDEQFLGYFDLHSRTERALFSTEHISRLFSLAGKEFRNDARLEWMAFHHENAVGLIEEAYRRLRNRENMNGGTT